MSDQERTSRAVASEILAERLRQVKTEGWSLVHDDAHYRGEMARAAAAYAVASTGSEDGRGTQVDVHGFSRGIRSFRIGWFDPVSMLWPWETRWLKKDGARRMLVKAAALLIAEIERLDRRAAGQSEQQVAPDGATVP